MASCSPLTPKYDVPGRPVEAPSCKAVIDSCNEYDPEKEYSVIELRFFIEDCQDALVCVYRWGNSHMMYNKVLEEALKKVN